MEKPELRVRILLLQDHLGFLGGRWWGGCRCKSPLWGRCSGLGTEAEASGGGLFPESQRSPPEPAKPSSLPSAGGARGSRTVLLPLGALVRRAAPQEGRPGPWLFPSTRSVPFCSASWRQSPARQWRTVGSVQLPPLPPPWLLSLCLPCLHLPAALSPSSDSGDPDLPDITHSQGV